MVHSHRTTRVLLALLVSATCIAPAWAVLQEDFGKRVARALEEGDAAAFSALLDEKGLLDRALDGMEGSEEFVSGLREGLELGLSQVGKIMVDTMGPEVNLSYLRTRTVQGMPRALVRVDLGNRGINYIDFFIRESADGSWYIFDWLDYVQGQTYTQSLRMAMALVVKDEPSLVSRMLGLPDLDDKAAKRLAAMGKLAQQGDWAGWLETYRTLPASLRQSRVLMVTRIAAAGAAGNQDEYMSAMADLHANQGDDPTLSLALVDYYLLTGNFARAYRAVDRLDEYTGGDAALTNLRAGIALHEGENAASVRHARKAIALDADYEDAYWNLLVAGSRAGDFKAAMEGVHALETRFGQEFVEEQLLNNDDFSRLASSDEWRSSRRAAAGDAAEPRAATPDRAPR